MSKGLVFWILMLVWFVFGIVTNWPTVGGWIQGNVFLFILFGLLGWQVFGPAIN